MLESDHEVEEDTTKAQPTKKEVEKVADDVAEKIVLDPLETQSSQATDTTAGDVDTATKASMRQRASKVASNVATSAKASAAKAAKVAGDTYVKVKNKTAAVRKEIGERTSKVAGAAKEATLDAIGQALNYAGKVKSALSKESLQKMRENAMKKYPQYFTGEADKNRQAFQDFLAQGAEPVFVEHGKQTQIPFRVSNGDVIRWNFRVLKDDIEFSASIRKMQVGGAVEENVRQPQRFAGGQNHQGSYNFVYSTGQVVLTFSNSYSWFKGKHVAYIAEVVSAEEAANEATTGHIDVSKATKDERTEEAVAAEEADGSNVKEAGADSTAQSTSVSGGDEGKINEAEQAEQQQTPAIPTASE